ncbi:hypothetical protein IMG5_127320, partial [Ichthyophthirius multifiliis]
SEEKCFQDDFPEEIFVFGQAKLIDQLPGVDKDSLLDGVNITVLDPNNEVVIQKLVTFGGNYKICLLTTTSHWVKQNQQIRFSLRIIVGEQENDIKNAASEKHINEIQEKLQLIKNHTSDYADYNFLNYSIEDQLTQANFKINKRCIVLDFFFKEIY